MLLTDLKAGSPISFVISRGDSEYEFPSNVANVYPDSILIPGFIINGKVLDLSDRRFGKMSFTIYYADSKSGKRLAFRGVSLEVFTPHGHQSEVSYYKVKSNGFAALAKVSERRFDKRTVLDIPGSVTMEYNSKNLNATIHDISKNGISFYCTERLDYSGSFCYIFLRDTINSHEFDIRIKCKIVRFLDNDRIFLYGCSIIENNKDYNSYVCLKQSEAKYIASHTSYPEESDTAATDNPGNVATTSKSSAEYTDDEYFQEMFEDSPTKRSKFFSSRQR